ncbi:MAG: TetR/AcrR family transcriptional regulator [Prevotellaceae bacterium]|nr:TetR/AcrR family transcriptional regulator [Prevotellaceae bacterium]
MKEVQQDTEHKILEAAERLFLAQGFVKTTTLQIAKEAGCNQALVHYYYRTKEHLFERIFGEKMQLLVQNLLGLKQEDVTFEERISRLIDVHYDFVKQHPLVVSFVLREGLDSSSEIFKRTIEELKTHVRPLFARLQQEVDEEVAGGRIRPISATDLALTILSLDFASFVLLPIMGKVLEIPAGELSAIAEQRKREVVEVVLARLRK